MRFGEHAATAKERAERMLCCPSRDALAATISKTGANSWVSAAQHGAECGVQFVARSEQSGRGDGSRMRGEDVGDADSSALHLRGTVPVGRGCAGAAHTERR